MLCDDSDRQVVADAVEPRSDGMHLVVTESTISLVSGGEKFISSRG